MSERTLEVNPRIRISFDEFSFSFARSQGPGGQNVNKLNTKATLRWRPATSRALPQDVLARFVNRFRSRLSSSGELILTSQRHREQARNVEDCIVKLRQMLVEISEPPRRRVKTKPTKGSVRRRLQEKKQKSEKKQNRRSPSRRDMD